MSETELPEGWTSERLGSVVELKYGKGLVADKRQPGPVPVYGSNGIVGWHSDSVTSGSTIVVGRKRSVGEVHYSNQPCWPIDTTFFVDEFGPFDSRFLFHLLQSLGLSESEQSTAIPGLSREQAYDREVVIAPLSEQRRIVAKVEALLARVNAARERLAKAPTILKRFRQSVLAAACSGQLTADWRERFHQNGAAKHFLEQVAKDHSSDLSLLDAEDGTPESWCRTTFGFLASPSLRGKPFVTSGSRGWASHVSTRGPYFVRSENINSEHLILDNAIRVAPPKGPETDRSRIFGGDLLLTITGNNVGRTAVVPASCPDAHVSQHVAIIRFNKRCYTPYFWLWVRSAQHGQKQLSASFYGETKPGLNLDQIKELNVDVPPPDEQLEIVRRVESLFAYADKIESRMQAAAARVEKITQAILAKAFRGELVPTEAELARQENRDYEPAAALLDRIRAARAVADANPAVAKRRTATAMNGSETKAVKRTKKVTKAGRGR